MLVIATCDEILGFRIFTSIFYSKANPSLFYQHWVAITGYQIL